MGTVETERHGHIGIVDITGMEDAYGSNLLRCRMGQSICVGKMKAEGKRKPEHVIDSKRQAGCIPGVAARRRPISCSIIERSGFITPAAAACKDRVNHGAAPPGIRMPDG